MFDKASEYFALLYGSSVALGAVVGGAGHLAVGDVRGAAFAPCRHMISVHLALLPDFRAVGVVANRAERTVGDALGPGLRRLPLIHRICR